MKNPDLDTTLGVFVIWSLVSVDLLASHTCAISKTFCLETSRTPLWRDALQLAFILLSSCGSKKSLLFWCLSVWNFKNDTSDFLLGTFSRQTFWEKIPNLNRYSGYFSSLIPLKINEVSECRPKRQKAKFSLTVILFQSGSESKISGVTILDKYVGNECLNLVKMGNLTISLYKKRKVLSFFLPTRKSKQTPKNGRFWGGRITGICAPSRTEIFTVMGICTVDLFFLLKELKDLNENTSIYHQCRSQHDFF